MNNIKSKSVTDFTGCQLNCVPGIAVDVVPSSGRSFLKRLKITLAYPWNTFIKKMIKSIYYYMHRIAGPSASEISAKAFRNEIPLNKGDIVRVRSKDEIVRTLDPFNELKGCAFLPEMEKFCGTKQLVFKRMRYFLDERDYKLKKTNGLILLENVFCSGTPVFGECDRSCFLFWREEWVEKTD